MENDLRNSAASGFSTHLVKPVDIGQLRAAIEATLVNIRKG
jgi:hypothetical protein